MYRIINIKRKLGFPKFNKYAMNAMERSRAFFILEGITGIGQFSLATGAFLAGFVSFLGAGKSVNGMLGVVPAAAGIFQILSSLLLKGGKNRKQQVIKIAIILRVLLSSIYFVPFIAMKLGGSQSVILLSFISCFILAFIINSLISPMISGWLIDLSPMNIRGAYLAKRDKISLGTIALTTIVLGKVLDYEKALNQEFIGFIVVGGVLSVFGVLNIVALINIEDVNNEKVNHEISFMGNILTPIKDKVFVKIIYFYLLWNLALYIGGPFIAVYMVEKLELSYTYMMTMTVIGSVIRVIFASVWGRIADRKSWFVSSAFSLIVLGFTHFMWGFVVPANSYILVPFLNVSGGIAWAGAAISLFNIQFLFAKKDFRTISISVNAAIGGIMSLIAVKVGGLIVDQGHLFTVLGFGFSGSQVSFMLSGILLLGCALYIHKIVAHLEMES